MASAFGPSTVSSPLERTLVESDYCKRCMRCEGVGRPGGLPLLWMSSVCEDYCLQLVASCIILSITFL